MSRWTEHLHRNQSSVGHRKVQTLLVLCLLWSLLFLGFTEIIAIASRPRLADFPLRLQVAFGLLGFSSCRSES